ncbi:MAG: glutamine synthetase, partial [Actinobacteria bacterium]|nr:glutamine synthetase [Actinomycetota bacterium]
MAGVKQPTRDELREAIRRGEIDTVVMAFPDLQGRLVGKRTTGTFFLQQVEEHG